jgi:FKBP-type peptidyl-prolyl cis-trans isomerase 2
LEKKSVELSPEEAYGNHNEKLVAKVPKTNIPGNAKVGDVLTDSNGNNWWVRQIGDDFAIVDGNHPLAGQALIFDIELIRIIN